jgi:hypothetical protein
MGHVPWKSSDTNLAFKYGFLMYSELVRNVMQSAMISSPTAEIMTSGTNLLQSVYLDDARSKILPEDEVEVTNNVFKNVFRETFEGFWLRIW